MKENKVIKAGMGYTIGNYLLKGINFFTIPLFARLLSPSDYGQYNIFVAYETIVFIILGFGIHTSYKNARYKYKYVEEGTEVGKDYRTYVSATMVLLIVSAGIWLICSNLFANKIETGLGIDRLSVNLLILYSLSTAIFQCYNADIGLEYKFQNFLRISGINAIANILLSVVLILGPFSEKRYIARVYGTTIPMIIISTVICIGYLRKAKPKNLKYFGKWGLRYSVPIIPHGLGQVILSQFDRIMIERMVSSAAAGIYSFAYNINIIINVTTQSLDNVWNPWFYEKMHQKDYSEIKNVSGLYVTGMSVFVILIMLVSPEMILVLGSDSYKEAIYCVIPIIVSGFFSFLYTLPSSVEYFYEKTKYIAAGTLGAAVLNVILNTIFIQKYGYVAAAYTTLFTYVVYFVFHYMMAIYIHKSSIYSHKVFAANIMAVLGCMFIALGLLKHMFIRWGIAIVLGLVTLVVEEKKLGLLSKIMLKRRS